MLAGYGQPQQPHNLAVDHGYPAAMTLQGLGGQAQVLSSPILDSFNLPPPSWLSGELPRQPAG